ncbi:NUDIX hydrolase [Streptomyces sp. DH12]|uniref:NUDIX hydrolase n=1 Tax=Streptomyces sp. DH12 TaxID=2857010 RepID=UPI001E61C704|nr:NUDIX hydrolase [Streptomyces sp. DH12]
MSQTPHPPSVLRSTVGVLVTDERARPLLVRPAGGGGPWGLPSCGCALSLPCGTVPARPVLAFDRVAAGCEGRLVVDGGSLDAAGVAAVKAPFTCVEPAVAAGLLPAAEGRRMLAALRARVAGTGPVVLEEGRPAGQVPVLDRLGLFGRPRTAQELPWHEEEPVPDELTPRQAWGWLFSPDGRVLVLVDPRDGHAELPGGTIEPRDASPAAALVREAGEEATVTTGEPVYLGYLPDAHDGRPVARTRFAAPLTSMGPSGIDPALDIRYARLLVTPHQAVDLLGWGAMGRAQAAAAVRAAEAWGVGRAEAGPVEEVPAAGGLPARPGAAAHG